MNSFADIKDQLIERLQSLWLQIQESDAFISLKERFENLPQTYQTLIKVFFALFLAWFVYSIPAGIMDESQENEELFVEHREMTREIIKAGRLGRSIQMPPPAKTGPALESAVTMKIKGQRVLPDQIKPLSREDKIAGKKLISKKITQNGIIAKLTKLNLQQVVNVAQDIDNIQGVRLINMVLQTDATDDHLFNVDYELASFSIPLDEEPIEKADKKKGKKGKKNRKGKKRR